MRVLIVSNMYPIERRPYFGIFVAREVASLIRAGLLVTVVPVAGDRGELDYFASRKRLRSTVREFRPQVLHAHYGYTLTSTVGSGVPLVVTMYGDDINGESDGRGGIGLKSRIGIGVSQSLSLAARKVLVQSEAMKRRLWRPLQSRAEILPSGVDDVIFSPGDAHEARARLGLPLPGLVLGFVNSGRQPTKRLDLAQATLAELRRRGHEAELLVAESVPAEEMPWYYRASDVLLMTSDLEGSPNCVKESLACGTPVVAVPVGDTPQVIDTPAKGRIVGRSPAELADGVESVLQQRNHSRGCLLPLNLLASTVARRLSQIYTEIALPA